MPGNPHIKWRKIDQERLSRRVAVANRQLTAAAKKKPNLKEYLPPKFSIPEIKERILTRQDFNREIARLNRVNQKSLSPRITSAGVKTTDYELRELQIAKSTINRRRSQQRKNSGASTYTGTLGELQDLELAPRQINLNTIPKSKWNEFVNQIEYQATDQYSNEKIVQYKQNMIKAIDTQFEYYPDMKNELITMVENINAETLYKARFNNPFLSFSYIYSYEELEMIFDNFSANLKNYLGDLI